MPHSGDDLQLRAGDRLGRILAAFDANQWIVFSVDHQSRHPDLRQALAPVVNATYSQECGSCHMAYPPGLLPPQAWAQIMTPEALANHYGDDASLSEELRTEISTFLGANAANVMLQMVPSGASNAGAASSLPRITESVDFKREHDEIPARLVTGNPEVGSFSQCNACHRKAAEGNYDERWIDIPGHGPWKD